MTTKAKPPKNADFSHVVKSVIDAATNEMEDSPESAAMKRGRLGGVKGGDARAKKLAAQQRSEIAKKAAATRWGHRNA